MFHRLRSWLRALRRRRAFEDGLGDEVRFHIEAYTADLVSSGVPPPDAARRARMEFGNVDAVVHDCREARGLSFVDAAEQDVRQALRLARRTPALTTAAITTIAICVGANLALFAVVNAVLLRPLPFPDDHRIVRVFNTYPNAGVPDDGISLTNYYERRGHIAAFSHVAAFREVPGMVGEPGAAERETLMLVSPEFFDTLGMRPATGRAFREVETSFGSNDVAIVSDGYWRTALGSRTDAVGRRIRVDGTAKTIVGVLPPAFAFLSSTSRVFLPLASAPEQRGPDRRHWGSQAQMLARLAPGVSLADAQAQVDAHNAVVETGGREAAAMAAAGFRSRVVPLRADHVAEVRPVLVLVQAGAAFLLGVGLVNLVNLLLIRAAGRTREFAIRQAIGAGRRHVLTELVAETLVITVPGGLAGVALGALGLRFLTTLGLERLPLGATVSLDPGLAALAVTVSVLVGLAAAVPVAWHNMRAHAAQALQAQSRTTTASRAARRLRHAFLVTQVALAFVLLSGSGLLALSLQRVTALSPGFRPASVLTAQITLPWRHYPEMPGRLAALERIRNAVARQPGVRAVGLGTNVPLSGNVVKSAATVAGAVRGHNDGPHAIYSYGVDGAFFEALGVPLLSGRYLDAADSRRGTRVCVVDDAFARRELPAGHALGQRLFMGGSAQPDAEAFTVVGVVGAVKQGALTDDPSQGAVFYPFAYRGEGEFYLVVRTASASALFDSSLQSAIRSTDPELAINDVRTMNERIDDTLVTRRSPAVLAAVFAAIALLLTAIGTYGVLAHAVVQRRREIGVRMALGARPAQVRTQFLGAALALVALGSMVGVVGAWGTGRAMAAMLFGVPPLHVPTLAATALVLGVVTTAACLVPAYRAARTSPAEVLAES